MKNEKGEIYHVETYRLITKAGGEHALDDATFVDRLGNHVGTCRDRLDDFAQQLGVPVKVVELPAIEFTLPGSR